MELQKSFGFLDEIPKDSLLLRDRFIEPPFTVLDARGGAWQDRKRAWLALGIQSELGRGEAIAQELDTDGLRRGEPTEAITNSGDLVVLGMKDIPPIPQQKVNGLTFRSTGFMADIIKQRGGGTSIFDPVLCELLYTWFCPEGGKVLDPFAGGSVRGIVANYLGYHYTGVDLIKEQVEANEGQGNTIIPGNKPTWIIGDSRGLPNLVQGHFDMIFTCPPYYNLEVYSEDNRDLSRATTYENFVASYQDIIYKAVAKLNNDRFACFVVGNIRDKQGFVLDIIGDTTRSFASAGVKLYNEAILITPTGSLPVRVGGQFEAGRKLGKAHQNILIFYKGDPRQIRNVLPQGVKYG